MMQHVKGPSLPPIEHQAAIILKRKENQRSLSQIVNDANSIESSPMVASAHNMSQDSYAQ